MKLATELSKRDTGKTLYILDEPTTGLHFEDIRVLMNVLNKLVDKGNTVIVIEHNLDVIKMADYIIDMGPDGGKGGGQLLSCGTPEEVAKSKKGYTPKFLKEELKGKIMKINKTNAARLLDKAKIAYELIPNEVDENDLSAIHVADSLGENIEQVFKTLVLHGDKNGHFVCVIPGEHEVDLKLAAKASGNKKCDLIPMKELLPLTGYIRGGCTPIGMKKPFQLFCSHFPDTLHNVRHSH